MNTHSADRLEPQFVGWLPDVVGKVPGMEHITYAGVTEVTEGDLLRAIYTNGHIKNANGTEQFRVAVSNTDENLGSCEMRNKFIQSVTNTLADVMTANKSVPA
ncbi:hypothetical protein KBA84_02685 [Patescibacteria group bacterium]|jgi:hypothetical protein|nr:hypothetical protein [Patescibacteria group bacterium]